MPIPSGQDIVESPTAGRERWIDKAAFSLYEARRAEFPDAYPLAWDLVPSAIRRDFRYSAVASYRRNLPLVRDVLIEQTAAQLATLDGYCYPDCDNKPERGGMDQVETNAIIAQRRQLYRHKARSIVAAMFRFLELDTETEAQRRDVLDRVTAQMYLDQTAVSLFRRRKGIPVGVNRG